MYPGQCSFELLAHDKDGHIKKIQFSGVYLIVDNGYLDWSCTVPPFGVLNKIDKIRWSKWLESMRKDVECTFGILKGRWRILKSGVRLHGVDAVDSVWLTCCGLHNWLLEINGLTEEWVGGVCKIVSDWDGEVGCLDFEGVRVEVPNALACLSVNLDPQNYDSSGLGPGLDVIAENRTLLTKEADELSDGIDDRNMMLIIRNRRVKDLSLSVFRRLLVNHFAILFSQNNIVWPERITKKRRRIALTS